MNGGHKHVFCVLVPGERTADVLRQLEYGNTQILRIAGGMNDGWDALTASTEKLLLDEGFKHRDLLECAMQRCREDQGVKRYAIYLLTAGS